MELRVIDCYIQKNTAQHPTEDWWRLNLTICLYTLPFRHHDCFILGCVLLFQGASTFITHLIDQVWKLRLKTLDWLKSEWKIFRPLWPLHQPDGLLPGNPEPKRLYWEATGVIKGVSEIVYMQWKLLFPFPFSSQNTCYLPFTPSPCPKAGDWKIPL